MEDFIEYLDKWHDGKDRPKNETKFVDGFLLFLKSIDDSRDVSFDGEGAYFGRQITIHKDRVFSPHKRLAFEVAYSATKISVYTAFHSGFWHPEYLLMDDLSPRFFEVRTVLFNLLHWVFGIPNQMPQQITNS